MWKEGATLEPTFPMIVSFHSDMGKYVCWLVWKGTEMLYHKDYLNKL